MRLLLHIHELLQYLNRQGANTFLTVAQHGLFGDMKAPVDVTYLADTVILLRYFEALGRVRRRSRSLKKRTGKHEDTIREFQITDRRPLRSPGEPLDELPRHPSGCSDVADNGTPVDQAAKDRRSRWFERLAGPDTGSARTRCRGCSGAFWARPALPPKFARTSRRSPRPLLTTRPSLSLPTTRGDASKPSAGALPAVLASNRRGRICRSSCCPACADRSAPQSGSAELFALLGNVTFLERPFHPTTFISMRAVR